MDVPCHRSWESLTTILRRRLAARLWKNKRRPRGSTRTMYLIRGYIKVHP